MKRKVYLQLLEWKTSSNGSSAALIEGARRIGKSYTVTEFARNEYDSYILIDFNNAPRSVFEYFENYSTNLDILLQLLSLQYGVSLVTRKSVIVFDEVQLCPKARALIKYLVADGRYDYIETGSLISIKKNVKDIVIPSEEHCIEMHPMDFEEFLWATGNDMLIPFVKECYKKHSPLGPLHRKMMELFRQYIIVGGMPQAVQTYADSRDLRKVETIKQSILHLYRDDIRKYATGAETKAAAVFETIPSQLQLHEHSFHLADLDKNARYAYYESAFFWLQDSKVVNVCYNTFAPNIGLGMNTERTQLKCYLGDTGLFISMAFNEKGQVPIEIYEKLLHGKLEVNLGFVMENIVAQMLVASGHTLYYYHKADKKNSENTMEIDFLLAKPSVTSRQNIIPLEVKSTSHFTTTSLDKCRRKFGEYVTNPIVLHTGDLKEQNGITYLPLYMATNL